MLNLVATDCWCLAQSYIFPSVLNVVLVHLRRLGLNVAAADISIDHGGTSHEDLEPPSRRLGVDRLWVHNLFLTLMKTKQ